MLDGLRFSNYCARIFSTSHSLSGMYMRYWAQSGHIWARATVRATPNVKRSPTLKSFTPAINLPQSGFSNNSHPKSMSHISCWKINFLKSVYYRITLSSPALLQPPYSTGSSASHFTWGWGAGLTQLLPPMLSTTPWHKLCVQWMLITWIRSRWIQYFWDPTPSSVEIL